MNEDLVQKLEKQERDFDKERLILKAEIEKEYNAKIEEERHKFKR